MYIYKTTLTIFKILNIRSTKIFVPIWEVETKKISCFTTV